MSIYDALLMNAITLQINDVDRFRATKFSLWKYVFCAKPNFSKQISFFDKIYNINANTKLSDRQ